MPHPLDHRGPRQHDPRRRRFRQQGSAYVIALLVLLILTTVGLSLVFVTATEMQIGANERTEQRNLAAAESGIGVALARVLVTNDYSAAEFFLNYTPDDDPSDPPLRRNALELLAVDPLTDAPCRLCEINGAGSYGASNFSRLQVGVVSAGVRPLGAGQSSEKVITATLDLQPLQVGPNAYAE